MRERSTAQQEVLDGMRALEIAGEPFDQLSTATLRALLHRGDVTRTDKPGSVIVDRWRLTDQGRDGPKPERSPEALRAAAALTETARECLFNYPRGHFTESTRRGLYMRGLIDGGRVTSLGNETRAVLREQAAEREEAAARG